MDITFICSSATSTHGGIETSVASLASELAKRHKVRILSGAELGESPETGGPKAQIVSLPFVSRSSSLSMYLTSLSSRFDPYFFESLTLYGSFLGSKPARILIGNSEIISTHTKYDSMCFSRWAASHGIPSVFHIQGSRFGRLFQALDRTTRYVAVSELSRNELIRRFGLRIPSTVTPGVPDWLLAIPRNEEDFILFIARLQRSKGTLEAVRIFAQLPERFQSLRLVVVGDGPGREEMEREAIRLGVVGRTEFLGSLPNEKVLHYYSKAKVLLFPSRSEVYPLVPLEAMASGCPVLASNLPSLRESTGGNILLLPPGDIGTWISAAVRLLDNDEERAIAVCKARSWARNHTWDRVARLYENELRLARESSP